MVVHMKHAQVKTAPQVSASASSSSFPSLPLPSPSSPSGIRYQLWLEVGAQSSNHGHQPGCSSYHWMSYILNSEEPGMENESTVSFTNESGFRAGHINAKIIDFCLGWCQALSEKFYSNVIFSVHTYYFSLIKMLRTKQEEKNQSKR